MALRIARPPYRLVLLALAAGSLLAGLWAGLIRLGWAFPGAELAPSHGPLLVAGVLGVVIGLERAVALGRGWAFLAPATAGLGGLGLIVGLPPGIVAALFATSSLVVIAIFVDLYRRRPEWATAVMAAGALAWLASNLLWLADFATVQLAPWWAAFLVLTIAGERLELAQVLLPPRVQAALLGACGMLAGGVMVSAVLPHPGIQVAGLGLLLLAVWLLRCDIARRTARRTGLARFGAVSLLLGYLWLGVAGVIWLLGPAGFPGAFWYDAMIHSLFLGFVFSMIFGHAPTIVPAVTGIAVPYTRLFYLHVAVLHGSLLVRIIGDATTSIEARAWGGAANAVAILLFAGLTLRAALTARRAAVRAATAEAAPVASMGGTSHQTQEERSRLAGPLPAGTTPFGPPDGHGRVPAASVGGFPQARAQGVAPSPTGPPSAGAQRPQGGATGCMA